MRDPETRSMLERAIPARLGDGLTVEKGLLSFRLTFAAQLDDLDDVGCPFADQKRGDVFCNDRLFAEPREGRLRELAGRRDH